MRKRIRLSTLHPLRSRRDYGEKDVKTKKANDVINTMVSQAIHYAREHEAYLKRTLGKTFKLFKPFVKSGPNTVTIKFAARKSRDVLSSAQVGFKLTYNEGMDLYTIEPFYVPAMTLLNVGDDKPVFGRKMDGIYFDQLGDPSIIYHDVLRKAKVSSDKTAYYRSYNRSKGDPKWIKAKYPGTSEDGIQFDRGDKVLYWPRMPRGKNIMVGDKAEEAWAQFQSDAADEEFMNPCGRYGMTASGSRMAGPYVDVYRQVKRQVKQKGILLVKIGDYYMAFDEDAKVLFEVLDATLTKRGGVYQAGIPVHSIESAISGLKRAGHKVITMDDSAKYGMTASVTASSEMIRIAKKVLSDGWDNLSPEVVEELKDDIAKALGGVPRRDRRNPVVQKLNKDIMRALNSM